MLVSDLWMRGAWNGDLGIRGTASIEETPSSGDLRTPMAVSVRIVGPIVVEAVCDLWLGLVTCWVNGVGTVKWIEVSHVMRESVGRAGEERNMGVMGNHDRASVSRASRAPKR